MKQFMKRLVSLMLGSTVLFGLLCSFDLSNLPPNGYGFLQLLRNESTFPAKVFFERNVNDNLPPESLVCIKSLSNDKYFRVYRNKDNVVVCVADVDVPKNPDGSDNPKDPKIDPGAQFKVKRYIDYNLNDYITFASDAVRGCVMSIDKDQNSKTYGKVVFQSTEFEDPDLSEAHWTLVPDDDAKPLDALCLTNASNGGSLHVMTKEEEYLLEPAVTKPIDVVWGVAYSAPAPKAEILKAYYGAAFYYSADELANLSGKDIGKCAWEALNDIRHGDPTPNRVKYLHVLDREGNEVFGSPYHQDVHNFPTIPPGGCVLYGAYTNDFDNKKIHDITEVAKQWPISGNAISIPDVSDQFMGGDPVFGYAKYLLVVAKNTFGDYYMYAGAQNQKANVWSLPEKQNATYGKKEGGWDFLGNNNLIQVAVYKKDDSWGITADHKLVHSDGRALSDQGVTAIDISVGADSDEKGNSIVWRVSPDNKVYIRNGVSWDLIPFDGKVVHIAARTKNEAWAVTDDGRVIQYKKDTGFQVIPFTEGKASNLDVADYDGSVWVINDQGSLFSYGGNAWKQLPGEVSCIAVQSQKEAWATNKNRQIFHWNGAAWTQVDGALASISISHGTEVTQPAKTAKRTVTTAYTVDKDGASYPKNPDARVAIEIVKLGIGAGGVLPGSTMPFATLPIAKKPKVSGFVENKIDNFTDSSLLALTPLINRGVAWLSQSFEKGSASVSFLANSGSNGDIQVVFGDAKTQDALCRVVIGADSNGGTKIRLRTGSEDGEPVFTTVYDVKKAQNPSAVASPGNFVPYTVSINDGLLLAFRGDTVDGELIAAYSIPQGEDPSFIGFGTNDQPIEYTEIKVGDPVEIMVPDRNYLDPDEKNVVSIPAGKEVTWTHFPFRIPDQGSFGFDIQTEGPFSIVFGTEENQTSGHYVIVIDNNLQVQKWDTKKRKYIDLVAPIDISGYELNPNPDGFLPFWVSYAEGVIMVGSGALGEAVLTVVNDPLQYLGVKSFGFIAPQGAALKNFRVAPQITFGYKVGDELYKKPRQIPKFSGSLEIILPFEYWFDQKGSSVTCLDQVTKGQSIQQDTSIPGGQYFYAVELDKTGGVSLLQIGGVKNPTKEKMLQDAYNKKLEAQQQLLEAGQKEAAGALAQELEHAKADLDREKAGKGMQTADFMRQTGADLIQAAAPLIALPTAAMVIAGIGTAAATASMVYAGLTEIQIGNATQHELEGAQQLNQAKQAALKQQGQAQQLQLDAQVIEQQAQTAFKDANVPGYVDAQAQRELGSATIPPEALANHDQLQKMLAAFAATPPATFDVLLSACEDILNVIDHPYVAQEAGTKKAVWGHLQDLYNGFIKNSTTLDAAIRSGVMNVLFAALNNEYLVDDQNKTMYQGTCYTWINAIVKNVLGVNKQPSIDLQEQYGEYIWLPTSFPKPDQGAVMFEVMGQHDMWICLSPQANVRMKGSDTEIYEVVLGGWNNMKSAIRLKSNGKSVMEVTQKTKPDAMLDAQDYRTFWISCEKGLITVGHDEPVEANKLFEWQDPYPITGIRYIGLSCWDTPVTVGNINVAADLASLNAVWQQLKGQPALEKPVFEEAGAEAAPAEEPQPEEQPAEAGAEDVGVQEGDEEQQGEVAA